MAVDNDSSVRGMRGWERPVTESRSVWAAIALLEVDGQEKRSAHRLGWAAERLGFAGRASSSMLMRWDV